MIARELSPLHGSFLKLDRAKKHIKELRCEIADFESSNPYQLVYEQKVEGGEIICRLSVNQPPPSKEWAVIIGDVVHNLRSALDLLACSLVKAHTVGSDCFKLRVSFPISNSEIEFLDGGLKRVSGASELVKTIIEGLQPYKGGNNLFYWISELDNLDKHRLLIPTFTPVNVSSAHIENSAPIDPAKGGATIKIAQAISPPFKNNAAMFRFIPINCTIKPKVNMDANMSLAVAFHNTDLVDGRPVIPLLGDCAYTVEQTLALFLPHVPPKM